MAGVPLLHQEGTWPCLLSQQKFSWENRIQFAFYINLLAFLALPSIFGDISFRLTKNLHFMLITNLTHFFQCIYFTCLHVSSNPVLIIRRINFINTPSGIYHSGKKWIVTRRCIDTIDSPDDEHWVARNMYRCEINTLKKYVKLVINTNCTEMHGQRNVKLRNSTLLWPAPITFVSNISWVDLQKEVQVC